MVSFDFARLLPAGLAVDGVDNDGAGVTIHAHPPSTRGGCPEFGTWSARVHTRYMRKLNDLPIGGRCVRLLVSARRFSCDASYCRRCTFAERLDGAMTPKARMTGRLDEIVVCRSVFFGPCGASIQRPPDLST